MIKLLRIFTIIALLIVPQFSTADSEKNYSFTFNGNDLKQFIMTVSSIMNYTVSIDNRVTGKVNVRSYKTITRTELLDIFYNQIYMNGFVVLQRDKSLRIVPAELAKTQAETIVVRNQDELRNPEIHNMAVVTLSMQTELSVKKAAEIIKPLLDSVISNIAYYESGNNIIVTDRKQNLLRVIDIINELTESSALVNLNKTSIYEVNYIDGKKLVDIVTAFIGKQTDEDLRTVSLFYDESSNNIVIRGSRLGVDNIMNVLNTIDRKPMQVMVEAIILELESENVSDLGIDYLFGGIDAKKLTSGLVVAGSTINGSSWSGLLKLLKGNSNTNVLSTPSIITASNKKAEIFSGREIPVLIGQSEKDDKISSSFKRKEVGLTLKVEPKITNENTISMNISQEISSIDDVASAKDVVVKQRKIDSSVVVPSGRILIIGGLYDEIEKDIETGLPLLSDIPGLGNLFSSVKTVKQKRSLFILLRPTIIDNENFERQKELLRVDDKVDEDKLDKGINIRRSLKDKKKPTKNKK